MALVAAFPHAWPAAHAAHVLVDALTAVENWPMGHAIGALPVGHQYPAAHGVGVAVPRGQACPPLHGKHVAEEEAEAVVE